MNKLFYGISLIILVMGFGIAFFIGENFDSKKSEYIVEKVTEEDLLEAVKLNLDYGWHHYAFWENRQYNGMKILCHSDKKILYSIDLEQTSEIPLEDNDHNYFTDYRLLYMGIVKKGDYYFRDIFYGDDMIDDFDEVKYCE